MERTPCASMSRCLAHRGPDDDGLYSHTDDRVSVNLAHRRLSIIDLSGGHQPLVKGPLALCYNGELYNYREIRAELRARGATFTTSSDTEVVLEAWRQWGPDCLRRFRGMFAFALFDQRQRLPVPGPGSARDQAASLPGARGRRGVLLRAEGARGGLRLRAAHGRRVPGRLDAATGGCPTSAAPSSASRSCSPAPGRSSAPTAPTRSAATGTSPGWRPTPRRDRPSISARSSKQSVAAHLVADVPVSSFLSGGLDSSIITRPGQAGQPRSRCLHHHLPARGSPSRGDARRRASTPARSRIATGSASTRSRSLPTSSRPCPRMVGILDEPIGDPGCHQHAAHVRGGPATPESR